jgi:8-oxo-dGTP pyrophosphatase MutT (NUDIX family)
MQFHIPQDLVLRVRAILLTDNDRLLFIKRVKPNKDPYWVAPGGGVEAHDESLNQTLHRELMEELGAVAQVIRPAFVLEHHKAGKDLREYFYICRLMRYDLSQRCGPEFLDPSRGLFLPDFVQLEADPINALNIKTVELRHWLIDHLDDLRGLATQNTA